MLDCINTRLNLTLVDCFILDCLSNDLLKLYTNLVPPDLSVGYSGHGGAGGILGSEGPVHAHRRLLHDYLQRHGRGELQRGLGVV